MHWSPDLGLPLRQSRHIRGNANATLKMSINTAITDLSAFDVVFQIQEPERLLNRTAQLSYHTAMELFANEVTTVYAWKAAFGIPERPQWAFNSVKQPETTSWRRSLNAHYSALRHLVNAEVERQVDGHL